MHARGGWIVLPENRAARQAVERVQDCLASRASRRAVNPLFLHGPPGCGKSRLVEELAGSVGRVAPDRIVHVLPAADFATLEEESERDLRQADLLVVEDVQHLPARQIESFVRLFDRGHARQQQFVFTASAGPALLGELPARLTSRLAAGLVVALAALSPESRLEYLRRRLDERGLRPADEVVVWLARHGAGSARQLEGAMNRLERLSAGLGRPVGIADLGDVFAEDAEARRPTLERIVEQVGRYFRVAPRQLCSQRRSRAVLVPRQVSMYLARQLTDLSLVQIGAYFGGRDHSTVLHACRKVERAMGDDVELGGAVKRLRADLA
jgi:chromosomal replication initiator protein